MTEGTDATAAPAPSDFIRDIVAQHVAEKRYPQIVTRFPPEPNGYLHIKAMRKAICLNLRGSPGKTAAAATCGWTTPISAKEETEYVDAIVADVRWLIAGWADQVLGLQLLGDEPFCCQRLLRPDLRIRPSNT